MNAVCPNCRQPRHEVGLACPELGCRRRGYRAVPPQYLGAKLDPRVGFMLGDKYLLVRLLGKGGMGVVMVALQQPLWREVALKVISGVSVDETMRQRFAREARAVAALDHPNIVKLVDFGVATLDEDAPYMVMELVTDALPLSKVFAGWGKEPPTWKVLGDVFAQLLSALEAAHDRGIFHRDIKPDNAMAKKAFGYDWFVKVLDFGLAKSFEHSGGDSDMPSLTDTGIIAGTPQYMAPEQLSRAHFGRGDGRVDLYAVGVMLFEVLLRRRPYAELDAMQLVFAKLDPERDPLHTATGLAEFGAMASVVRTAMAHDVTQRYLTAAAMRDALLAAVQACGPTQRVPLAAFATATPAERAQVAASATRKPNPGSSPYAERLPTPLTGSVRIEVLPPSALLDIGDQLATQLLEPPRAHSPVAHALQRAGLPKAVAAVFAVSALGIGGWWLTRPVPVAPSVATKPVPAPGAVSSAGAVAPVLTTVAAPTATPNPLAAPGAPAAAAAPAVAPSAPTATTEGNTAARSAAEHAAPTPPKGPKSPPKKKAPAPGIGRLE
ncbi:MAG: serine/threonine protein kinase [Myxococcales bacterium]|nr:serine/threonine protein kinase [Myxococcales bacterium]